MHVAGAELRRHFARTVEIAGLNIAGKTVRRVIGEANSFFFRLIRQDRKHRAEDFFPRDGHVVGDIRKHGRLDIIAAVQPFGTAGAASDEGCTFLDPLLDEVLDAVVLRFADHRTQHGAFGERIADLHLFRRGLGDGRSLVMLRARHEHAAGRVAGLARIGEHVHHATGNRLLQVGIVQNDIGGFAAQFLGHALHRIGSGLCHRDACACRTGERHHVDIGMMRQRLAHRGAIAIDKVEHTRGNTGFIHHLGKQDRIHRRDFRRLQHHGAAGGECRRHLAGDLVDGPVPRRDHADNADRFAHDGRGAFDLLELVVLQHFHRLAEVGDAHGGLRVLGQAERRAHFAADGLDDILVTLLIDLNDLLHQREAFFLAGARPGGKSFLRGGNRLVHVGSRAQRNLCEGFFVRRVDDIERFGRNGVDPLPVNVEFQLFFHDLISPVVISPRPPPAGIRVIPGASNHIGGRPQRWCRRKGAHPAPRWYGVCSGNPPKAGEIRLYACGGDRRR